MTESPRTKPEAAVPDGTAASASSPAPAQAARTGGSLLKAIFLSLFVCPGLGHRHLGRITAGWIVLGLFLLSFIYLGVSMNQLVQNVVTEIQGQGSNDLLRIISRVEAACKNAPDVSQALDLLLTVYFGAAIELIFIRLLFPKGKSDD